MAAAAPPPPRCQPGALAPRHDFVVVSGIGSEGLPLYSKEALARSPSAARGLDAATEARWRREYTNFISGVGMSLEVPQWAIYTAVFLCHHYFAKRAMQLNDRYLVATACLYLACKVQESPKYLRDVIKQAEVRKWSAWCREHPMETKKWEDMVHLEAMRDQVLVAERAVLYTLAFQLRISTPYPVLLDLQKVVPEAHKHNVVNIAWSLINDSLQTNVSLLFAPEKLAAAALFIAYQVMGLDLPAGGAGPGKGGYCALTNTSADELLEISQMMLSVYAVVQQQQQQPGSDSAEPTAAPSSPSAEQALQVRGDRVVVLAQALHAQVAQQKQQQQQQQSQQQQQQQQPQQHLPAGPGPGQAAAPAAPRPSGQPQQPPPQQQQPGAAVQAQAQSGPPRPHSGPGRPPAA